MSENDAADGPPSVSVATWNLMWRTARSRAGRIMTASIAAVDADIWVLTETHVKRGPLQALDGHIVAAGPDWGYRVADPDRRKVLLYSRNAWVDVELLEERPAAGRLVAATTETSLGPLRVVGVCIPWKDAHVSTGHRDRRPWAEHLRFPDMLPDFLVRQSRPLVLAGDLNQRLQSAPSDSTRRIARERLQLALAELAPVTAHLDRDLLDHIAITTDLQSQTGAVWSGNVDGSVLTDHFGAVVTLSAAS